MKVENRHTTLTENQKSLQGMQFCCFATDTGSTSKGAWFAACTANDYCNLASFIYPRIILQPSSVFFIALPWIFLSSINFIHSNQFTFCRQRTDSITICSVVGSKASTEIYVKPIKSSVLSELITCWNQNRVWWEKVDMKRTVFENEKGLYDCFSVLYNVLGTEPLRTRGNEWEQEQAFIGIERRIL